MKHDIKNLDLNLLKTFDALFDERSVTGAAKKLYLTQPAVSGMLQRLRDYFEDPLFTRSQRGINPTLRALELAPVVKNILSDIHTLLKPSIFAPKEAELTLRIAATDYALKTILVPYIAELRRSAPKVQIAVVSVHNDEIFTQLERGVIDFALITPEHAHLDLHTYDLFEEHYVCLMSAQHQMAQNKQLSIDDLCSTDHALISHDGGQFVGVTDLQLKGLKKRRQVMLSVNSFLILPEILSTTDLIAVVPSRLTQNLQGFKVFEPPLDIPHFTKTLAWHERNHRDAAQQWLRLLLIQTAKGSLC